MIRGVLYWIAGSLITLMLAIFVFILFPFLKKGSGLPHKVSRVWAKTVFGFLCGVKLDIRGLERIEREQNYIIVSNHRSYTDIFTASWSIPLDFRWLAKSSLFRIPVIGFAMRVCGYIPIERERSVSASKSLDRTKKVLQTGKSVWIFPEGTRTPKPELGIFKRGAFVLAKDTGIPLLPVVFVNTDRVFLKPAVIRPQRVGVFVLPPVSYGDFVKKGRGDERKTIRMLSDHIRRIIQTGYDSHAT
ncbi:MAG: 1-acyl-sn-glycerol-3-phosphate acyltransferase [Spirochaetes bacterium]|nr:1-acyl-sn-glycerol-3-phosphate acyltransferase [Spirochaetota bacterium]